MATSQDSSGINNPSSNFVQNLPPAPPRPLQHTQITPAQAMESLGHLEAQNDLLISTKVFKTATLPTLQNGMTDALIGYGINRGDITTTLGDSISKAEALRLTAAVIIVPTLEVGLHKISEHLDIEERDKAMADLKRRPGFLNDFENADQAMRRHAEIVERSLFDGAYDFDPSLKARALKNVSHAYLSGSLSLFPSPDVPQSVRGAGAGALLQQEQPRTQQFAQADRLLEAMRSTCGNEQRSMAVMTPQQQEAFSWGRSAVETHLIGNHTDPEVKEYIKDVYLDFLEEMDPEAMRDFMSRSQAVMQARKLFASNLPESKFKKGIEKIKENLGLGGPSQTPPTHAKAPSLAPPAIKPLSR